MRGWREIVNAEERDARRLTTVLPSGEKVFRQGRSLIIDPCGKRWRALSTSMINGGFFDEPGAVFNTQSLDHAECCMTPEEYPEYARMTAEKVDLDPDRSVYASTAVNMDNAVVVSRTMGRTMVSAIVTAGVEGNGGRAGDPASYDESVGYPAMKSGTIVIIVVTNARLPDRAMVRAVMTATEAKTCALQQLMASSKYSSGIASGSGTDQVVIVCDKDSDLKLADAGKHSALGELIGICVLEGVIGALDKHAGLNPESQRDVLRRIKRYGITEDSIIEEALAGGDHDDRESLRERLEARCKETSLVIDIASVVHLMDEISWGLIPREEGRIAIDAVLRSIVRRRSLEEPELPDEPKEAIRVALAAISR